MNEDLNKRAEEVARNIFTNVHRYAIGMDTENVVSSIAQALTAYAEERVKEALRDFNRNRENPDDLYVRARAEALEEAAKLIDSHEISDGVYDEADLGDVIRALINSHE